LSGRDRQRGDAAADRRRDELQAACLRLGAPLGKRGLRRLRLGATEAAIAVYTGLPVSAVRDILDKHYLNRDPALAASAAIKLERWSEGEQIPPTAHPTGQVGSERRGKKAE
jgi:hypothetical protein